MSTFGDHIRSKLHSSPCPGQGARGELAYIESNGQAHDGGNAYYARLYVWDSKATGREVAAWFKEAGAVSVEINEQVHDEGNTIFEGITEDGARSWDIYFAMAPTDPTPPPPTICMAEYQWRGQTRSLPAQTLLDALALECPPVPMTLTVTLSNVPNPFL